MESQLIEILPKVYLHIHQEDHENLVADQEKWNQISKMNARTHASRFHKNQPVAVQHHVTKEWSLSGKINREVAPQSYKVSINKDDSTSYELRRNQKFLRKLYALATLTKEISNSPILPPSPFNYTLREIPRDSHETMIAYKNKSSNESNDDQITGFSQKFAYPPLPRKIPPSSLPHQIFIPPSPTKSKSPH